MPSKIVKSDEAKMGWIKNVSFTDRQKILIKELVAKSLNDDEFNLFIYRCLGLGLDPLKGEISCQVRSGQEGRKMVVIVQRDGYLTIAHKSGFFGGMESGTKEDEKGRVIGWSRVWNKSFSDHPVYVEVYMDEYNSKSGVWNSKPRTMIQKVAESQALRRAFNISGVYSEEELDTWDRQTSLPKKSDDDTPATDAQVQAILAVHKNQGVDVQLPENLTKGEARIMIQELTKK